MLAFTTQRRRVVLAVAATAVFALGIVVLRLAQARTLLHWWSDLWWTLASGAAAAQCFQTARLARHRHVRHAWLAYGVGCAAWCCGMLIWNYYELVLRIYTPFPSIGEPLFYAIVPCFVVGVMFHTAEAPSRPLTLKQLGDLGVASTAVVLVNALVVYRPAAQSHASASYITAALTYPALHGAAVIFALLYVWRHLWGPRHRVYALQMVGLLALALSTMLYAYLLLLRGYEAGSWIDPGWVLAFALFIAAGREELEQRGELAPRTTSSLFDALVPDLLVAAVAVAWVVFHDEWPAELDWLAGAAAVGFSVALIARAVGTHRSQTSLVTDMLQLEAHYARLLEAAPLAIACVDDDGAIRVSNRRFVHLVTAREAVPDELAALAREARRAGAPRSLESWRNAAGVALEVHAVPERDGAMLIAQDVSLQREAERAVFQAQRLDSLGVLAGGLAHDLNNLITILYASSSTLRRRLTDPALTEQVDMMRTSMGRATELTQRLLHYARSRIGEREEVDVGERVASFGELLRASLTRDIELRIEAPRGLRAVVDPAQLEQVLLNLAFNARDAMPDGGMLEIAVRSQQDGASMVEVRVSDTGTGIPRALQERVFEPMFTTKAQGNGLGLAVVSAFARNHDGRIELDSEPGRGTTFRICIPAAQATAQHATGERPRAARS